MFLKDGQILVDDFRHKNFEFWLFFGWVMAILVKNISKFGIKFDKEECLKTIACFKTKLTKLSVN